VATVDYDEAGDGNVCDGARSSERCEGPIMACLPAEWPGPSQARPTSIVSVETILVR
jgi:hypothetical protein